MLTEYENEMESFMFERLYLLYFYNIFCTYNTLPRYFHSDSSIKLCLHLQPEAFTYIIPIIKFNEFPKLNDL